LHLVRDANNNPAKLYHGQLHPHHVLIGPDGQARVAHVCRAPALMRSLGRGGHPYLAPEVLLHDESADARADVYAVGVMLWEALHRRPLFAEVPPGQLVVRQLAGIEPIIVPPDAPWAAPLVEIIGRSTAPDPALRYPSAVEMNNDLRKAVGARL